MTQNRDQLSAINALVDQLNEPVDGLVRALQEIRDRAPTLEEAKQIAREAIQATASDPE